MKFSRKDIILPGQAIGPLRIGMTRDEARAIIGNDFDIIGYDIEVWKAESVRIWFDKRSKAAYQILVDDGFPGQTPEGVAIGTSLAEATRKLGPSREHGEHRYFESAPFTCFCFDDLTADEQEINPAFDEMDEQIIYIAVFAPGTGKALAGGWKIWCRSLSDRDFL